MVQATPAKATAARQGFQRRPPRRFTVTAPQPRSSGISMMAEFSTSAAGRAEVLSKAICLLPHITAKNQFYRQAAAKKSRAGAMARMCILFIKRIEQVLKHCQCDGESATPFQQDLNFSWPTRQRWTIRKEVRRAKRPPKAESSWCKNWNF